MCHCEALRGINRTLLLYPDLNYSINMSTGSCFHHCRSGDEFQFTHWRRNPVCLVFFFFRLVLKVHYCWAHHFVASGFFFFLSLFQSPTNLHSFTSDHLRLPLSQCSLPSAIDSRPLTTIPSHIPQLSLRLCPPRLPSLVLYPSHLSPLFSFHGLVSVILCVCVCVCVLCVGAHCHASEQVRGVQGEGFG